MNHATVPHQHKQSTSLSDRPAPPMPLACILMSPNFADGTFQGAQQDADANHQQPQARPHVWHCAMRPLNSAADNSTTDYSYQVPVQQ